MIDLLIFRQSNYLHASDISTGPVGETVVRLTTKMCYFIGHEQTNKALVDVVNEDQNAHFSESFASWDTLGLTGNLEYC